jgi:outer membrane protein
MRISSIAGAVRVCSLCLSGARSQCVAAVRAAWVHGVCFGLGAAAAAGGAHATDLLQIYERALNVDPQWQQAVATHLAARETKTQALINLLPLDLSANKDWQGLGGRPLTTPGYAGLNLAVNLFSWSNWIALKAANATVAQAEANYQASAQSLVQRVATQYFAVLNAQETLNAEQSALDSVQRQLDQAEQRYQVGLIGLIDVETTRAERDSTAAAVIADKRALATQQDLLRAITDDESYASLAAPRDNMPLLTPEPADENTWVATAMNQNSNLIASRMAADIARDNLLTAYGGHLPQISISVSRNWALEHGNFSTSSELFAANILPPILTDPVWQADISIPLFQGGATQSKIRQARYTWDAAKDGVIFTSRQTEEQTRDAYQGLVNEIEQVRTLRQAVNSNDVALQATEAGYQVGTKTVVDVLVARQNLVQAQTNYAQAKYSYLDDIVALRYAAGTLDRRTIEQINGWLTATPPAAAAATPPAATTPGATPPP